MNNHWASDAVFYHIYPLGFCGAPARNDFCSPAVPRLNLLYGWMDHIQSLGANALYLGPVFESSAHGYDTVDYYHIDRRLGSNALFAEITAELHRRGIRVILDGVFNHVGRDFWAFYDLRMKLQDSAYRNWFHNLTFGKTSPYGDPFSYEGWSGHYDLVKLNLDNPAVRQHLFGAVEAWVRDFGIDGLRLDAADSIDMGFLQELAAFCRRLKPDFWLMGEVVHGNYTQWVNPQTLDSVTNYECYKGLYSSHVDRNYFEIAYSLNRQFGESGIYRDLPLYNFADNHDVNRVASNLGNPAHLYPLYSLLFSMPGVPSLYYGSEWGIRGKRSTTSDAALRPQLDLGQVAHSGPQADLAGMISRLVHIRQNSAALRHGSYRQVLVNHEQFAFARQNEAECVLVLVNAADQPAVLDIEVPDCGGSHLVDLLDPPNGSPLPGPIPLNSVRKAHIDPVPPHWARILQVR